MSAVRALRQSFLQGLFGSSLARSVASLCLHRYAGHRIALLDRTSPALVQTRTLLSLVAAGRETRFGKEHDFHRIRTVLDYQVRVPLRTYEEFWKQYWQTSFPDLAGTTWPGRVPFLALSSGTTTGVTKYIPVTRDMLSSNRRAALTSLALFLVKRPQADPFRGRLFFLGGSTNLTRLAPGVEAGDLSGIAAKELSDVLRPFSFPTLDLALIDDWMKKVEVLAERSCSLPITVFCGNPSWMLVFLDRLKRIANKDRIIDIWPSLELVMHGGVKFDPYRGLFRREIGSDLVAFQEVYPCSEGFVAAEDPRYDLLRLIPDHGIFFEFVPVEELESTRPTRHTVADIVTGVQYAPVLTTCAGLWGYVLGDTVCFENRDPPLFRFTGRTRYFLSAFGEHLIQEEVEQALTFAARRSSSSITDFHVGPVFPERADLPGRHRYIVEFRGQVPDLTRFGRELDEELGRLNKDYGAHRQGGRGIASPEICVMPAGGFAEWLRSRNQLGGQHKVPRMDDSGTITRALSHWVTAS
jgi:hypothetical protein